MRQFFITRAILAATAAMAAMPLTGNAAAYDAYPIPAKKPALTAYGATMPYTRYDCNKPGDAVLSGGASILTAKDWDPGKKASSASDQAYVNLPKGAGVKWTSKTAGDGVTVRYTIKDNNVGKAGEAGGYAKKEGKLDFYVQGEYAGSVDINSYHMYQYFSKGSGSPSQSGGDAQNFCFDERHVQLNKMVQPGQTIEVRCSSGEEVGIDFIELEVVPEEIDPADEADGRQIFNVTSYGAKPDQPSFDNRTAFTNCFNAASKVGGVMFIPAGTWYMGHNGSGGHGIWSVGGKNVKVCGAGMWHTNIQFTGWKQFGGGISGGNPSNCGSGDMENIEFCHMYINSNLADRHGENAVYKCFMDIYTKGSLFHDIWEQHFECGWWFGDYNGAQELSNARVVNCRIRDNFADGVNFCQGTSNSAVFNCSVRNNGDDGLACWDAPGHGQQGGNVFCFNTIDFIWRAGGIAIYGGHDQKAYNNYICDMFMASGIHCNDIFSRAGSPSNIEIDENILVRCGTLWENWGRDYGAIDFEGTNVSTMKNNYLYECPAEAIRIKGQNNVTIDGLYVNGAGISGGSQDYSASAHSAGLGNVAGASFTLKNMKVVRGSIPEPTVGANLDQYKSWPWWDTDPGYGTCWTWIEPESEDWCTYVPGYPTPQGIEIPINIWDELQGYDVVMTGIDWNTQKNKPDMYDGDQVTFRLRLDNNGTAIPEEGKFNVVLSIDGQAFSTVQVKGLSGKKIIDIPVKWTATKGEHTFSVVVDPQGKMKHETKKNNNTRSKSVNVNEIPEGEEPEIEIVPTGAANDMGVVKVWFEKTDGSSMDEVSVGDKLIPHAIVANFGKSTIKLGAGQGVLWGLGAGSPEYNTGMRWNDKDHTIAPGEWIDVTPTGGGGANGLGGWNNDNTYTVVAGDITLTCRMDNPTKYNDGNAENNMLGADFTFPKSKPVYNENPDKADDLDNGGLRDYQDDGNTPPAVTGFDLTVGALNWIPNKIEIAAGTKVNGFSVNIRNASNVSLPADSKVRVSLLVDGKSIANKVVNDAIAANGSIDVNFDAEYEAAAGGHTIKALIGAVRGEADTNNNTRERTFNARGNEGEGPVEPAHVAINTATPDCPFYIEKVEWYKDGDKNANIAAGDQVRFTAYVKNVSENNDKAIKHGIQFQIPVGQNASLWCDSWTNATKVGDVMELTTNGGNVGNGVWTAEKGETQVMAWFNDTHDLGNWQCQFTFTVQIGATEGQTPEYINNPTGPDNVNLGIGNVANATAAPDVWHTLQGVRVARPTAGGVYIHNGKKVIVK